MLSREIIDLIKSRLILGAEMSTAFHHNGARSRDILRRLQAMADRVQVVVSGMGYQGGHLDLFESMMITMEFLFARDSRAKARERAPMPC